MSSQSRRAILSRSTCTTIRQPTSQPSQRRQQAWYRPWPTRAMRKTPRTHIGRRRPIWRRRRACRQLRPWLIRHARHSRRGTMFEKKYWSRQPMTNLLASAEQCPVDRFQHPREFLFCLSLAHVLKAYHTLRLNYIVPNPAKPLIGKCLSPNPIPTWCNIFLYFFGACALAYFLF